MGEIRGRLPRIGLLLCVHDCSLLVLLFHERSPFASVKKALGRIFYATSAMMDSIRQELEETKQERETRSAGHFSQEEKSLSVPLGSRFWNIPVLDNVTSYFGGRNPLAKNIDPSTEIVWLLDNTAYRPVHKHSHDPQPWQAEYVVAFFKKHVHKDLTKAVAEIADKIGLGRPGEDREAGLKTIERRLQHFVRTIAPARFVEVGFPGGDVKKLGPGGRSAVSEQTIANIAEHKDRESVSIPTVLQDVTPYGPMTTTFAEPEGWLVISGTLHVSFAKIPNQRLT